MTFKTLIAAAVAAAFALPFSASAAGDKADKAASSSDKSAASGATKSDGGAEAMFKSLDKNKDGFMSKEEVKGTPHDKDFSSLDKNKDGKLSRQEHAAAPEHAGKAGTGASASESKKPQSSSKKY
jgi:Ca2+-binding EF-hand superfamily protein